jgi:hypothetical protein
MVPLAPDASEPARQCPPDIDGGRLDIPGVRLVFASTDMLPDGESGDGDTTVVPVGPDFLAQVALWPCRSHVVETAARA